MCKITPEYDMNEVTKACGDFFGATLIDTVFWTFLEEKLGPACFKALKNSANLRTCYRDISHKWDAFKREFSDTETAWKPRRDNTPSYKTISLTAFAMDVFSKLDPPPKLDGFGEIRLTLADMKSFFDPVINSIRFMITRQLDEANISSTNKLDYLFLVGGFSASPYFKSQISKDASIRSRVKNIPIVDTPDGCVLEGASWYAFRYKSLKQRISTKSLGVRGCRRFDPNVDELNEVVNPKAEEHKWVVNKKFIRESCDLL